MERAGAATGGDAKAATNDSLSDHSDFEVGNNGKVEVNVSCIKLNSSSRHFVKSKDFVKSTKPADQETVTSSAPGRGEPAMAFKDQHPVRQPKWATADFMGADCQYGAVWGHEAQFQFQKQAREYAESRSRAMAANGSEFSHSIVVLFRFPWVLCKSLKPVHVCYLFRSRNRFFENGTQVAKV